MRDFCGIAAVAGCGIVPVTWAFMQFWACGRMSQPMSRILYPFGRRSSIWTTHCWAASSSYLRTGRAASSRPTTSALKAGALALLPVGFTWPPVSPQTPVRSYRTLSPLPLPYGSGGLLSVALSRGSLRVAVSNHRALWSPDFPRPAPTPSLGRFTTPRSPSQLIRGSSF